MLTFKRSLSLTAVALAFAVLLGAGLLGGSGQVVHAGPTPPPGPPQAYALPPVHTTLSFLSSEVQDVGATTVKVRLTTTDGATVAGQQIVFQLDAQTEFFAQTGSDGVATLSLSLAAGQYGITAGFDGGSSGRNFYYGTTSEQQLTVVNAAA